MKAIIPVAGIGSRLRPHTHTQPKSLIPVAGKPILAHIISPLIEAGIKDYIFIIGYLGDKIENYITENFPEIHAQFVIQTTGKGIGHAIWLAHDLMADDEEIFIVLGDTIFDTDLKKVLQLQGSALGTKKVADPRQFGVAELDDHGFITKLVEKPSIPKSNLALVGLYKIKETARLKAALAYNIEHKIKTQNEYHLTDALMRMVDEGISITTFDVDNWFDCGKKEVLLATNATLLKRLNSVAENIYENTIIIPPVYIHPTCQISNSIIGPDVSIGDHAVIHYSILKDSIIGPYAQLENAILHHSLIGNDASFQGPLQSLNIGDSTEINFG
jgi:glucose-1-phosphate thymidylyltransferase